MGFWQYGLSVTCLVILLLFARYSHSLLPTLIYWSALSVTYFVRARHLGRATWIAATIAIVTIAAPMMCAYFLPEAYLYVAEGSDKYSPSNSDIIAVRAFYYSALALQYSYTIWLFVPTTVRDERQPMVRSL